MNQRTTTSPCKIILETHNHIQTWEGPWDSDFETLLDAFIGLCSVATYGDKSELYKYIYDFLQEEYNSEK